MFRKHETMAGVLHCFFFGGGGAAWWLLLPDFIGFLPHRVEHAPIYSVDCAAGESKARFSTGLSHCVLILLFIS